MEDKNKKWYQSWWGILLLLFLSLVLACFLAFGLYVYTLMQDIQKAQIAGQDFSGVQMDEAARLQIEGANNYWIGSSKPKITIVEFGDYACSQCGASFPKIREIASVYKKDIKYIFRDFPVVTEYSFDLALASRCAGEQGLFWVMHDQLFMNQGIKTHDEILNLALSAGVNEDKFVTCMDTKKYAEDINRDITNALELEAEGTPTWFINGGKIQGDIPYEFLVKLINKILE